MKQYLDLAELQTWSGAGRDGWIKMRFNRNYANPILDNEMEAYLVPACPSQIRDITTVSDEIAREIYETYGNIYVAMSGGIDSEWIAKSFFRNGIPFTPIIYEAEDLNAADTWWAHKWCADNGLTPVTYKEYVFQYVQGIVKFGSDNCLRTPGGPYVTTSLAKYVEDQGGYLVTGAGFPELFPDPNLSYMSGRFLDSKLMNPNGTVRNTGWILHEADFIINKVCSNHPWNFLSWRPDIFLSYLTLRTEGTSEFNKAKIFDCLPRPKSIGVPDIFWRSRIPLIERWVKIKNRIGSSEVDYIGPTDQLRAILTTGDINAK